MLIYATYRNQSGGIMLANFFETDTLDFGTVRLALKEEGIFLDQPVLRLEGEGNAWG